MTELELNNVKNISSANKRTIQIVAVVAVILLGLFMFKEPASALISVWTFVPDCIGPARATTMGTVGPGPFQVAYTGTGVWLDSFYCNDVLGCFYVVSQQIGGGDEIWDGTWWSPTAVSIWQGWC